MLKNLFALEYKNDGREIKIICDVDCPLNFIKEALFQFSKYVGHIEDQAKLQQEQKKEEYCCETEQESPKE